jgi:hypothetical protein
MPFGLTSRLYRPDLKAHARGASRVFHSPRIPRFGRYDIWQVRSFCRLSAGGGLKWKRRFWAYPLGSVV